MCPTFFFSKHRFYELNSDPHAFAADTFLSYLPVPNKFFRNKLKGKPPMNSIKKGPFQPHCPGPPPQSCCIAHTCTFAAASVVWKEETGYTCTSKTSICRCSWKNWSIGISGCTELVTPRWGMFAWLSPDFQRLGCVYSHQV